MPSELQKTCFLQGVQSARQTMYRLAFLLLKHPADAEDAVSDAIEIAWKNVERIRDLLALPSYLMRTTINAAHKLLRLRKRETTIAAMDAFLPLVKESSKR